MFACQVNACYFFVVVVATLRIRYSDTRKSLSHFFPFFFSMVCLCEVFTFFLCVVFFSFDDSDDMLCTCAKVNAPIMRHRLYHKRQQRRILIIIHRNYAVIQTTFNETINVIVSNFKLKKISNRKKQ